MRASREDTRAGQRDRRRASSRRRGWAGAIVISARTWAPCAS